MDLQLTDKVVFVTGTGSQIGFGRGIAVYLASEGCHIISADIDLEGAEKTATDIQALKRKVLAIQVDITDKNAVDAAVAKALSEFGNIDILVNCAGRASGVRPFVSSREEQWAIDFDINFKGAMYFMRAILPHMLERKYGKIVNFSTHAANQPTGLAGAATYVAAKAGIVMLSKTIAGEVGPSGVNVNIIAPGPGATNFHRVSGATQHIDLVDRLAEMGKAVLPEDIAYATAFLVSDVSGKLSGQVIEVAAPLEKPSR